ncbi:MAG: hypothetical protein GY846_08020 [Deltaproteobacteria bacterium]|nr:hypothetical protein [Deltaproteobacteria bacterium]
MSSDCGGEGSCGSCCVVFLAGKIPPASATHKRFLDDGA